MSGCAQDPIGPTGPVGEAVGVILSSVDRGVTVFSVDSPEDAYSIGFAPDGSPVSLAARGAMVAIPLGTVPAVAIVDLETRAVARTVALRQGSGAQGVAFLNDSIAIVGNPGLNTVSPVNVLRGTRAADIPVGTYPQAAVAVADTVFVVNANLGPDFSPAGPASISVITGSPPRVVATIGLSGENSFAAVATSDGQLVVVNSGSFGAADGSLSFIDRATLTETDHIEGFGDFPGAIAIAGNGRIHVASFSYGVVVWDPATRAFTRSLDSAIEPDGVPSASGVGADEDGRIYTLVPECGAPGRALRLTATYEVDVEISTGICPFGIVFTRVPG